MWYNVCIFVAIIGGITMPFSNIDLTTKYKTDKIVFSKTGSVDISTLPDKFNDGFWVVKKLEIPHGMPRPLFINFRFKIDADTKWRTGGSAEDCLGYSDSTYLTIMINNITTGTLYYELFGSWIDDYDTTNPLVDVSNIISTKLFDSRLKYRKIILDGSVVVPDAGGGVGSDNIPHTLGTSPTYQVYFDGMPNEVWQSHSGGGQDPWGISNIGGLPADNSDCFVRSTTTDLVIGVHGRNFGVDDVKVWYRIFGDG